MFDHNFNANTNLKCPCKVEIAFQISLDDKEITKKTLNIRADTKDFDVYKIPIT